jgi:hypothetical protein
VLGVAARVDHHMACDLRAVLTKHISLVLPSAREESRTCVGPSTDPRAA